jgi:hypothetical protein
MNESTVPTITSALVPSMFPAVSSSKQLLSIDPAELQLHIENTCGIGAEVVFQDRSLRITCKHHHSCFEIMRKLRLDFDYDVEKRGKLYTIVIR